MQALRHSGEHWVTLENPACLLAQPYNIVSTPYSRYGGEIGEMSTPKVLPIVDIGRLYATWNSCQAGRRGKHTRYECVNN